MTAQPDLTVIIVSWNVRELLERCLSSVLSQSNVELEIIVVDNASRDGTVAMVRQQFPKVALIANDFNAGFAKANNQAYHIARGRNILLLNPDTVVPDGVLQQTAEYLDRNPKVGVLGCRVTNPDGTLQPSVNRFPTLSSQALVLLKLHVLAPWLPAIKQYNAVDFDYNAEADVDQVLGAFFGIRRQCMEELGSLDESFFVWFEEVDFCKRAHERGWKVRYTPQFSIIHHGGQSFGQLRSTKQQKIFNASLLTYMKKHMPGVTHPILTVLSWVSMVLAWLEEQIRKWNFIAKRLNYR